MHTKLFCVGGGMMSQQGSICCAAITPQCAQNCDCFLCILQIFSGILWLNYNRICLFVFFDFLCLINNLSVIKERVFLGWTSTKLGLTCLAQGHNAVTPVRLEPTASWSRVKHSTTEPLHSQTKLTLSTNSIYPSYVNPSTLRPLLACILAIFLVFFSFLCFLAIK